MQVFDRAFEAFYDELKGFKISEILMPEFIEHG